MKTKSFIPGTVYLTGAGIGSPDLITIRAWQAIRAADVILYDALLPSELLEEARPYTELIYSGKLAGRHSMSQEEINRRLIHHARSGKVVIRLKGGDPMIFGRGGEEALALLEAGVPVEIIPGVSSLQVCAASAGIPLTHRGIATGFRVLSGDPGSLSRLNAGDLSRSEETLVFFMARDRFRVIIAALLDAGMEGSMPVAWVSDAGGPSQTVQIAELKSAENLNPDPDQPGLLLVGRTVSLHFQLPVPGEVSHAVSHFL
ncbi:MAG: uroporphyrinogen-III C-methyltransferase [Bacteroidetes bacterium]|nr:uroporphyrinogen-III C-methyltransferase [Bacteroidota bacterium]